MHYLCTGLIMTLGLLNLRLFQPNLAYSFVIYQAMDDFGVQTKIREHILFTGFIVHVVCARYTLLEAVVLCH